MGGVKNEVCMATQNKIPAHRGSKPSLEIIGVKIGTRIGTIPTHSIKRPKIKKQNTIIHKTTHLFPEIENNRFCTISPPPINIKVPVNTNAPTTMVKIILETWVVSKTASFNIFMLKRP